MSSSSHHHMGTDPEAFPAEPMMMFVCMKPTKVRRRHVIFRPRPSQLFPLLLEHFFALFLSIEYMKTWGARSISYRSFPEVHTYLDSIMYSLFLLFAILRHTCAMSSDSDDKNLASSNGNSNDAAPFPLLVAGAGEPGDAWGYLWNILEGAGESTKNFEAPDLLHGSDSNAPKTTPPENVPENPSEPHQKPSPTPDDPPDAISKPDCGSAINGRNIYTAVCCLGRGILYELYSTPILSSVSLCSTGNPHVSLSLSIRCGYFQRDHSSDRGKGISFHANLG